MIHPRLIVSLSGKPHRWDNGSFGLDLSTSPVERMRKLFRFLRDPQGVQWMGWIWEGAVVVNGAMIDPRLHYRMMGAEQFDDHRYFQPVPEYEAWQQAIPDAFAAGWEITGEPGIAYLCSPIEATSGIFQGAPSWRWLTRRLAQVGLVREVVVDKFTLAPRDYQRMLAKATWPGVALTTEGGVPMRTSPNRVCYVMDCLREDGTRYGTAHNVKDVAPKSLRPNDPRPWRELGCEYRVFVNYKATPEVCAEWIGKGASKVIVGVHQADVCSDGLKAMGVA